jgi:putative membrane protein insertion efficiency factor
MAVALLILIAAARPACCLESWGPWSVASDAPVLLTSGDRETSSAADRPETSMAATPFLWLLKIYQGFISPIDGDRCPMYPTCSRYSILAIRKHGPFLGVIMTSDRLLHEADEQPMVPVIQIGNRYRYADPVDNNDFWWYGE